MPIGQLGEVMSGFLSPAEMGWAVDGVSDEEACHKAVRQKDHQPNTKERDRMLEGMDK